MNRADKFLITGAASGIGQATAKRLDAGHAQLVLVDRNFDGALLVAAKGGPHLHIRGDVTDEAFWEEHAPVFAGLTGAVINAGVSSSAAIIETAFAEWRQTLAINLDGAFLTMRAAMRAMMATGNGGAIVTTASISGIKAESGTAAYGASKAGLIQLTKVAAKEGAAHGIRVNAVAPGGVDTPMWDSMDFFTDMVAQTGSRDAALALIAQAGSPLGRFASADDIAQQIAFLLSEAAASMTGTILISDGGYSL